MVQMVVCAATGKAGQENKQRRQHPQPPAATQIRTSPRSHTYAQTHRQTDPPSHKWVEQGGPGRRGAWLLASSRRRGQRRGRPLRSGRLRGGRALKKRRRKRHELIMASDRIATTNQHPTDMGREATGATGVGGRGSAGARERGEGEGSERNSSPRRGRDVASDCKHQLASNEHFHEVEHVSHGACGVV